MLPTAKPEGNGTPVFFFCFHIFAKFLKQLAAKGKVKATLIERR
jgi:hypothetical protein